MIVQNKNIKVNKEVMEKTKLNTIKIKKKKKVKHKLKVASMFAGCGGLDYAFHKQPDRYNVVYVNDFDKDSCNTYEKYYTLI